MTSKLFLHFALHWILQPLFTVADRLKTERRSWDDRWFQFNGSFFNLSYFYTLLWSHRKILLRSFYGVCFVDTQIEISDRPRTSFVFVNDLSKLLPMKASSARLFSSKVLTIFLKSMIRILILLRMNLFTPL